MSELSDPFGPLMASATQLHEIYTTYIGAGFTADQALALTCLVLQEAIRKTGAT